MALVDYPSDSENEDDSATQSDPTPPQSALPSLPAKFQDLYASNVRTSTRDDPRLHGGRKRITPHVAGNWPSHLYIEWHPSAGESELLSSIIREIRDGSPQHVKIETFLMSELGAAQPLHISLSRPIGFATHEKDAFLRDLKESIKSSGIKSFNVAFSSLTWVSNFTGTRWFLVLNCSRPPQDNLNELLVRCNDVVTKHGKLPLYDEGELLERTESFHVSIAWTLSQPTSTGDAIARMLEAIRSLQLPVSNLKAKIGNEISVLDLSD